MITKDELNTNFYSKKRVAQQLGVSIRRVEQLLTQGRFEGAFRFANVWLIPKEAVDNFQRKPQGNFTNHKRKASAKQEVSQWLHAAGYGEEHKKEV